MGGGGGGAEGRPSGGEVGGPPIPAAAAAAMGSMTGSPTLGLPTPRFLPPAVGGLGIMSPGPTMSVGIGYAPGGGGGRPGGNPAENGLPGPGGVMLCCPGGVLESDFADLGLLPPLLLSPGLVTLPPRIAAAQGGGAPPGLKSAPGEDALPGTPGGPGGAPPPHQVPSIPIPGIPCPGGNPSTAPPASPGYIPPG